MIEQPAFWVALAAMIPLMISTAYADLKALKIPNVVVIGVFATFLVTGFWGLPYDVALWRLLYAVIALAAGFGLFSLGVVGAGDAKMIAALVPFVAPRDTLMVLGLYTVSTIAMLFGLYLITRIIRGRETGWVAIDQFNKPMFKRQFPMGLIFAITIVVYLCLYANRFYSA